MKKIKLNTKELSNKLNLLSGIISNNATLPILECVLFEAENGTLKLTAGDLENTIITTLNCEVLEPFKVAIPYRIFSDTIKMLPNANIEIIVSDTLGIEIHSDKGVYKMVGENSEDFPKTANLEAKEIILNGADLQRGIKSTLFAVSNDELRPAMTGVYFHFTDNKLKLVSTDASRLALYSLDSEQLDNSFIVPKKALNIIKSSVFDDDIYISANSTNVCFKYNDVVLISRLVDAKYPAYEAIIPTNEKVSIIDKQNLLQSLKRTHLFSNKTTFVSKLKFENNILTISSEDIDYNNSAVENVNCTYDSELLEVGFNSKLLIEALQTIEEPNIKIEIGETNRASIIKPNDNFIVLVMPLMI